MISRIHYGIIFLCILTAPALCQQLHQGEWRTYTAMSGITDIAISRKSGNIWASTSGGAFRYSPGTAKDSVFPLRNTDGLSDNNLSAVAADSSGNIFFGGANGTLDIFSEKTDSVKSVSDITSETFTQKRINAISIFGDTVYLSTGFGLSIYNSTQHTFGETITKFGSLKDQDTVFAATIAGDSIYVVQSSAIAVASIHSPSLEDPRVWRIIPSPQGTLNSIVTLRSGKIVVGGSAGIFSLVSDSLSVISTGVLISVISLTNYGNTLFVLDSRSGKLFVSSDLQTFTPSSPPSGMGEQNISAFAMANFSIQAFGFGSGGIDLVLPSGTTVTGIFPEGPIVNIIADLDFAASLHKLFVSLGANGMSIFDPQSGNWKNLQAGNSILPSNNYTSSFYDSSRSLHWIGTFGGGLFSLSGDLTALKHFGNSDGIPGNLSETDPFIVVGKPALDAAGNFICGVWTHSGKGFIKSIDGKTFQATSLTSAGKIISCGVVAQDQDRYYYVGTVDQANGPFGVFAVVSPSNVIPIPGDGKQLGSPSVNALIVDQDNELWCGTNVGVDVLTHSNNFQNQVTFNKPRRLTFTDQQIVNCIAVDGVGNKWVGTKNGVFILNADGSDSLAHFTTGNSPLIDNTVTTIAIDNTSGEAYFGTPSGISRYHSIFQQGKQSYAELRIYPNPVIEQPDEDITVTITGLAGGSTVNIYSLSGRLVASIDASGLGSTATWNGRDQTGKFVHSGIYLAAAASPLSSDYGMTKFVVIRK